MAQSDVVIPVEEGKEASEIPEKLSILTRLKNFFLRNFLPIGTVIAVIFGIFLPQPAVYVSQKIPVVKTSIIALFFTIGLRVRLVEAKSAIKSYKEVLFGLLLAQFVAPSVSINVLNQIPYFGSFIGDGQGLKNSSNNSSSEEMPIFGPEEFRLGLQIYYMCPSAPATSLIMVTAANGLRGLSILVTLLSVIISVFLIPPMMAWFLPALQHVHLNVWQVLLNTVLTVLLPLAIGRCLRCVSPVKKVVKKLDSVIKYFGISSLILVFLVQASKTSASGNLDKVSVVNILCAIALGTSLTTFNVLSSYGLMSILPWFSVKSTVTLSIVVCIRVIGMAATIFNILPDNTGDKGLLSLIPVFVFVSDLVMLNSFVYLAKVKEEDHGENKPSLTLEKDRPQQDKDNMKMSNVNCKINEAAVFTIYTDEMSINDTKL